MCTIQVFTQLSILHVYKVVHTYTIKYYYKRSTHVDLILIVHMLIFFFHYPVKIYNLISNVRSTLGP